MASINGVLIDLDGVVYQNSVAIPGAIETIQWLEQQNIPHLFVTNTTSKPVSAIVKKLQFMGVDTSAEHIVTPVVATISYLQAQGIERAAVYVVKQTLEDFSGLSLWQPSDLTAPGAVVLGDIGEQWDFKRLNQAFGLLMENPECELIGLGMTRYFKGANGLQLDVGPFVKALAYAVDIEPVVMGKPAQSFFHQACAKLGLEPEAVCMIGDDARSDVAAAQAAGLKGAQVKTGKFQARDLTRYTPDYVFDTLADLPAILRP